MAYAGAGYLGETSCLQKKPARALMWTVLAHISPLMFLRREDKLRALLLEHLQQHAATERFENKIFVSYCTNEKHVILSKSCATKSGVQLQKRTKP